MAAGTTLTYDKQKGAVFSISKPGQAPTITSKKYIFFGRVEVECLASSGTGIVTSSVLQSDDLDEIDWVSLPISRVLARARVAAAAAAMMTGKTQKREQALLTGV